MAEKVDRRTCVTPKEVAQDLGCKPSTVIEMIRRGDMPGRKVGRYYRIPKKQYELFMEQSAWSARNLGL